MTQKKKKEKKKDPPDLIEVANSVDTRERKGMRRGSGTHRQLVGHGVSPVNRAGTPSPVSPDPALSPSCFGAIPGPHVLTAVSLYPALLPL